MYPQPPTWNNAPDLVVDQDFDHWFGVIGARESPDASSLFHDGTSSGADISWVVSGTAGSETGGAIARVTEPYHKGVISLTTKNSSGDTIAIGLDVDASDAGDGSLTTPSGIALGPNIYRWEWLINITSIANVNYRLGVLDASPLGTVNNGAYLNFDTNVDANWHAFNINGGSSTDENTSVAATTGWHRFVGELRPDETNTMAWHYYIDHTLIRTVDANKPTAPVTMIAAVRTRTSATKSILVDRARLWTDGHNQIFGGSP
jgi:hypothetical protein